jgi:hypothetical protein
MIIGSGYGTAFNVSSVVDTSIPGALSMIIKLQVCMLTVAPI